MREKNGSRYEQFETSPETIEQEVRPVDCDQRQTDRFKENYSMDDNSNDTSINFYRAFDIAN